MRSPRLEKDDFLYLNDNLHPDVSRILTAHALNIHNLITEGCVDTEMSTQNAIELIEKSGLEGIQLPEDYPDDFIPAEWQFGGSEYSIASDNIGIIVGEKYNPEMNREIFNWLYETLSKKNGLSFKQIREMFLEDINTGFGGKMGIQILRI